MTPERTAENWLIVDSERRNDDPHVCDDNWHRGAIGCFPYVVPTYGLKSKRPTESGKPGIDSKTRCERPD